VFKSLIITPDMAWKDVFEKLMTHVVKEHPQFYAQVNQETINASAIIVTYVLVGTLVNVLEENQWLKERAEKMRDTIMGIVGYEPIEDEEEEEEEEDNTEETEDPNKADVPVFESD
jgi:hypothetical protein